MDSPYSNGRDLVTKIRESMARVRRDHAEKRLKQPSMTVVFSSHGYNKARGAVAALEVFERVGPSRELQMYRAKVEIRPAQSEDYWIRIENATDS